ncbi:MAG: TorF family putative porin [Pseudomonadota bacterium]
MARRDIAGIIKSTVLGAALAGGLSMTAQANELSLSASTAFTTDYVFRGISQTDNQAAVQGSLDAAYGMFYIGMWASNLDFGGGPAGQDIANLEIDYYAGITPEWQGVSFDIGGIFYTYPGAYDPGGDFDYFELKTGASYTFADVLTVGVTNYWSPEFFGETGSANAIEIGGEYVFDTVMNFFDPSVSGLVGFQTGDDITDYTYWNVGLTLGFMENFAADIRYWDTDLSTAGCGGDICDERVVGTISASF